MFRIDKDAVLRELDPELFRRLNEMDKPNPYVGVTDHLCKGGQYIYPSCADCRRAANQSPAPYERVNHPKHYNEHPAGIECVDVVEEMSFNLGNAVKYIWRSGLKPDSKSDEDLAKAEWYLKRERERLAKRTK